MEKNLQRGSVIIFSLLLMTAMLGIALTLASIFIPKIKTIAEAGNSVRAIYAADSGVEVCLYEARNQPGSAVARPLMTNNATFVIASLSASPLDITNDCRILVQNAFKIRVTGTYSGVSRALEISQ